MNIKDKLTNIKISLAKAGIWLIDFYRGKPIIAGTTTLAILALIAGGVFLIVTKGDSQSEKPDTNVAQSEKTDNNSSYSLEVPKNASGGSKLGENIGGNVTPKDTDIVIGGAEKNKDEKYEKFISHLETIDYKKIAEEAKAKSISLEAKDEDLRKWIVRLDMIAKIQDEKIKDEDLVKTAKTAKDRRHHFFNFVKHGYSINPTDEEVKAYIDKKAPNAPETIKIAEGLGISVKDLNYVYDLDQYKQQLVWDKLLPVLKEKTPKNKGENEEDYLKRIDKIFNEALDAYIKAL